jgi:hypothetical protein
MTLPWSLNQTPNHGGFVVLGFLACASLSASTPAPHVLALLYFCGMCRSMSAVTGKAVAAAHSADEFSAE